MRFRSRDGRVDGHCVSPSRARRGSRALSGFAVSDLPARMHEVPETTIAGHPSRDSTLIEAREQLAEKAQEGPEKAEAHARPAGTPLQCIESFPRGCGACGPGDAPVAFEIAAPRAFENPHAGVLRTWLRVSAGTGRPATCSALLPAKRIFRTAREVNTRVVLVAGPGQPGRTRGRQPGRFPGPAAEQPIAAVNGSRESGWRSASPPGCRGRRSRSPSSRDRQAQRRGRGRAR